MKKFADWLFKKFCHPDYYSSIRGDLEEVYAELVSEHSPKKADLFYFNEIILLFRLSLMRPLPKVNFLNLSKITNMAMLKTYLVLGIRHLKKNKLISIFNVSGLALAIACCTVIFVFLEHIYHHDQFHQNHEKIFLATFSKIENKQKHDYGFIPIAVSNKLETEFPEVEQTVKIQLENAVVQYNERQPFYERIKFASTNYLDVFNFPLLIGDKSSLKDRSRVIISSKTAERYFGFADPIGKTLEISIDNQNKLELIVAGVAKRFPNKRSFDFDFLVNIEVWQSMNSDIDPWLNSHSATFIKTYDSKTIADIQERLDEQLPVFAKKRNEDIAGHFKFYDLSNLALETYHIRNDISKINDKGPSSRIAFATIGLLLLTIACLNYINTATAQGANRIKEIGIRKVIGGKRSSIIAQFLMENMVVNAFALLIGIFLAYSFMLPAFDALFGFGLQLEWSNPFFWLFIGIILFISTILSGTYPAFYLSKFQPNIILKGSEKIRFKNSFSKIFLTIQFFIAFVYIVVGILFTVNTSYQKSKEMGYLINGVVVVKPKDATAFNAIRDHLAEHPHTKNLTFGFNHIASSINKQKVGFGAEKISANIYEVAPNYIDFFDLEILAGAIPILGANTETDQVLINETFADMLGVSSTLEKQITIEGKKYFIAGVVNDFQHSSFQEEIEPICFKFKSAATYPYLIAQASEGNERLLLEDIENVWKKATPNLPFNGFLQNDIYERFFSFMLSINKFTVFISILAVLLSCTGLFGLVYLDLTARIKDYSIMKVLGASTTDITKKIIGIFMMFLLVAIILGFPASIYGAKFLFGIVFNNHVPINSFYPILAAVFLIGICMATIAALIYKINKQNPVVALKKE